MSVASIAEYRNIPVMQDEYETLVKLETRVGSFNLNIEGFRVVGLDLGNRNLTQVPNEVQNLRQLERLNLEHNALETLPEWLHDLSELRSLFLGHNNLVDLPKIVLPLLTTLDLSHNHLNRDTINSFLEHCTALEVINLSANNLEQLPQILDQLPLLRELFIYDNPSLKNVDIDLLSLETLSIGYLPLQITLGTNVAFPEYLDGPREVILSDKPVESLKPGVLNLIIPVQKRDEIFDYVNQNENLRDYLTNEITNVELQFSDRSFIEAIVQKWLVSPNFETKQLGKFFNRILYEKKVKKKGKSFIKRLKENPVEALGAWLYVIIAGLGITIVQFFFPDFTSLLQSFIFSLAILAYFVFQLYSGITLDRYALSFTQRAKLLGMVMREGKQRGLFVAILEKVQSSMGIIIGIMWLLAIRSVSNQSAELQGGSWSDSAFEYLSVAIENGLNYIDQAYKTIPVTDILPAITLTFTFIFEGVFGIFIRTIGILTIFWAIHQGGWRVLINPTHVSDANDEDTATSLTKKIAIPLGIVVAFFAVLVDNSLFQGLPTFVFQVGLILGGFLFVVREKHVRYSISVLIATVLTFGGIILVLTIPLKVDLLFPLSALLGVVFTYVWFMPGIVPRNLRSGLIIRRGLTLKPNIFTYLGQPQYWDAPSSQFWKQLTTACNLDTRSPGIFAFHGEGSLEMVKDSSLVERTKEWDLSSLVFLLEFYVLIPALVFLISLHVPFYIVLVLIIPGLYYNWIFNPVPKALRLGFNNTDTEEEYKETFHTLYQFKNEKVTTFEFSMPDKGITTVPSNFFLSFANLRSLSFHGNRLEVIPESIGSLSTLEVLNLTRNRLASLPETIGELKYLKELHIGDNNFVDLPESLYNLKRLQKLNLGGSKISTLSPRLGNLTNLQWLRLEASTIQQLPESVGELKNLKMFHAGSSHLQNLPESFGNLTRLEYCNIMNHHLNELPESIGMLTSLKTLILSWQVSGGGLRLPDSFGNLVNLQELQLQGSGVRKLPVSSANLVSLQVLDVSQTGVEVPDAVRKLPNLQKLEE